MSIAISIRFLAGRYHATPWDRQVNEGVVEWPPSPWRILRALVSAYYHLPDQIERAEVCQLLTHLAERLPCYELPPSVAAHTRHYMPIKKEGKFTTTKVFDTFLAVGSGALEGDAEVKVVWETTLSQSEIDLLRKLCAQVSYLGRAESWAELSVETETTPNNYNAYPFSQTEEAQAQIETVKVLVPLNSEEMTGFQAALAVLPQPKRGKGKWKVPGDLLEVLELDIANLHSQGWSGIPGSRWATYAIAQPQPSKRSITAKPAYLPNFARFAIVSNVLPNLTEAVSVGDRFRQSLMKHSCDDLGVSLSVFSGRDESGQHLEDNHQHAYYLPEADDQGKIKYIVVYAARGFCPQAILALQRLRKVWGSEGFDLQTILVSLGKVEDYGVTARDQEGRSPLIASSCKWRSLTPLVLPRHPKKKIDPETGWQVDGVEHQTVRLLSQLSRKSSIDSPSRIEVLEKGVSRDNWQKFQRRRYHGGGAKGRDLGYWLELEFEQPQQGPIAIGYAAHFGLGVFIPVS